MIHALTNHHDPVLLSEVLIGLAIDPAGLYIDATFGRGGHSRAILEKLNAHGCLYVMDKDPEAIIAAKEIIDTRFHIFYGSFIQLIELATNENIKGKVSGILLDIGVSSPQLDDATRGFSFLREGPLDMRMDTQEGTTVAEWLRTVKEATLTQILKDYGEERFARRIAKAIISTRDQQMITTTTQLADIVAKAHPAWSRDKHPATQTFQALRIFINQELTALQTVLPQCLRVLKIGGRLAVISFHSLEDRIVKRFIQQEVQGDPILHKIPIKHRDSETRLRCVGRRIHPSASEIKRNPRSRSATLRIVEKIK